DAADVESPLKPEELQVLRAQYEKEGEYVGLQTKFNYAWGLIKSNSRPDQQEGVRLLSEIFRNSRERRRECLYYLALGNFKLGNYAEARRYNELLLELEPANLQAGSLKGLIDEKVAKEGLVGAAIVEIHRYFGSPTSHYTHSTMDRSTDQPAPGQNATPAHRDMMFCHECADEWYRDEHGLTCPECGSDFTEIIEENNDPRDNVMYPDEDDDDNQSMPNLEDALPPHRPQNPWADDPDEGDISDLHFTQTAPGSFNVRATITRSVSPTEFRAAGGMGPASIGGLMSMLSGIARAGAQQQLQQGQDPDQSQAAGQETRSEGTEGQTRARFIYHGGARLHPRDANNPEPRIEPVDDIANVVTGIMAALGAPPGSIHTQRSHDGDFEARFGGEHHHVHDHDRDPDHAQDGHAQHTDNPFLQLFSTLGMLGPGGQMGDFVYSQEGLDRIVSQLMEQTANSNAPGPASQADIDSLERKKVDEEMLGAEHKAECSICMDEVNIGEEVTLLPCKHWFHHSCVSVWLSEHDTCPHCRKGITRQQEGQSNDSSSGDHTTAGAQASGPRQMPGAFDML
ncbi:hypothetical protein GQ44DRAFT_620018, partial [Phaeosphaeriaceae sp. PMI808]